MSHYVLKTLGCKANLYDSQLLEEELQKRGWSPPENPANPLQLCIINSCTVTNEADRQTRKLAAKLARENPQATVVVTGCAAEVDPEGLAKSPGIHYVVGNQNKNDLVELVLNQLDLQKVAPLHSESNITSHILKQSSILGSVQKYKGILSKHPLDRDWPAAIDSFQTPPTQLKGGWSEKTRAFLKIQEGCNSFCTYCIIPYGRGPGRSLRPLEIIRQVRELVGQGIREVVLTGTNIGEYGVEWSSAPVLGDLIAQILDQTSLERLRVSSLDPTEITPQIFGLMEKNPRFCPHFHVSLQSPRSKILKLMKRKYVAEDVKTCLEKIASLSTGVGGVFVGMDVIAGFPGETEEEFELGLQTLAELPWQRLHVFPYSEREGTPATRLPGIVPPSVRVERGRKLNQLSLERLTGHYKKILEQCKRENILLDSLLMEKQGPGGWISGYTPNYLRVLFPTESKQGVNRNDLVSARPLDLMVDAKAHDVAFVAQPILPDAL